MKVAERIIERESTLSGERVAMSIDTDSFAHIMSVLTDLYSDPELAVLREYSTNALDAHVEAGVKRPIEVSLPTPLDANLRIRDYGLGLDADDIREVYSRYGTSTKRGSNEVVGMLGLGCKSALTYTDQFLVTGTKDGTTTQVAVGRDEDGSGTMTIVASYADPDAEPGVEIIVPTKNGNRFQGKAERFFRFWPANTVLVNGREPDRPDLTWIVDQRIATVEDQHGNGPIIVMGNVPYPVAAEGWTNVGRYRTVVSFVDIGEVNFTPSREALQYTRQTKDTVADLQADLKANLVAAMQTNVNAAKTHAEALVLAQEAKNMGIPVTELTFKGKPLQPSISRVTGAGAALTFLVTWSGDGEYSRYNGYRKAGDEMSSFSVLYSRGYGHVDGITPTLVVDEWEGAAWTDVKRAKAQVYIDKHLGGAKQRLVAAPFKLNADDRRALDGLTIISYETLKAIELPKNGTTKRALTGSYEGFDPREYAKDPSSYHAGWVGRQIMAADIDQNKVLWVSGNRWAGYQSREKDAGLLPTDHFVICLPQNRREKFLRDFPNAVRIDKYAITAVERKMKALNEEDIRASRFQTSYHTALLKKLDHTKVNDPLVKEAILLAQRRVEGVTNSLHKYRQWAGETSVGKPPANPLEKYPLLNGRYSDLTGTSAIADAVLYLNAAFAAGRG